MRRRVLPAAIAAALAILGSAALTSAVPDATCTARGEPLVRWIRTAPDNERAAIDRWCAGVGPPVRIAPLRRQEVFTGPFAVVSWNTHVGGGDLEQLVADLRSGRLTAGRPVTQFVLLLQEVYRGGSDVPVPRGRAAWAAAEQPGPAAGIREGIVHAASRLGLAAVYVPSMRNGAPRRTDEDRGNAIVSTAVLADPIAIELPLERQRRVSVEATIRVHSAGGEVPVALVDTHFTNMVMHHVWLFSMAGRTRQAHALAAVLPASGPMVVGGDFNAWFGFHDAAYREMARLASPAPGQDRRATFGPMRLDHLLFRLPEGWRASLRRAERRYGSDHYPLVALVEPR
jgi:endonuclease/exonuclease/phosphatase family metal-dependent hydrolase